MRVKCIGTAKRVRDLRRTRLELISARAYADNRARIAMEAGRSHPQWGRYDIQAEVAYQLAEGALERYENLR